MFSVRLVPAGKELDILVTGKRVKKIVFADLELLASIQAGERQWFIPAKRKNGHFRVATPAGLTEDAKPKLKIEIRHKGDVENFDFDVNPTPR